MSNCAYLFHVSFRNEYSPTEIHKRIQSITEEYKKQKDNIKHQNAGIVAP